MARLLPTRFSMGACLILLATVANAAEPAKPDGLQRIDAKLAKIEAGLGSLDRKALAQELREARQWIDEYAIQSEAADNDPKIAGLYSKLADLALKVRSPNMPKATPTKPAPSDPKDDLAALRAEVESALKPPVDLSNVSFKRDVAPTIAAACVRCHNPKSAAGGYDASTYASFMIVNVAGDPEESYALQLVTGQSEPRMPRGSPTGFPKEWAEVWRAWLLQGAKFDGPDENAPIANYLVDLDRQRRDRLEKLSNAQIRRLHRAQAELAMKQTRPHKPIHVYESENVLSMTTLPERDAEYVAVLAEAILEELREQFGIPADQTAWRGRLAIHVFADRYDFGAYARQVDDYSPESEEVGYLRLLPERQSIALTAQGATTPWDDLVAEWVAHAFFQSLGDEKLPPWAAYGLARCVAHQQAPTAAKYQEELAHARAIAERGTPIRALFDEAVPWVELAPMSASFFRFLMDNERKRAVAFTKTFAQTGMGKEAVRYELGVTLEQLQYQWAQWLTRSVRPGSKKP